MLRKYLTATAAENVSKGSIIFANVPEWQTKELQG
jgi:hypothetical protein